MVNELLVVTTSVANDLHNTITNNHHNNNVNITNNHQNDNNITNKSLIARNLNNNIKSNNFNIYNNINTNARLTTTSERNDTTTTLGQQQHQVNYIANQMSSEPIKIELDCALNAYTTKTTTKTTTTATADSHLHTHHHHHHHHHHLHLQSNENVDELIVDEDDDDELITDDDEAEGEDEDEKVDDDQNQVDDDVEQASDDSGSGTSSSVESSTSGTSSAAGCSEISTSSLANAYSTTKLTNSSPYGADFGNTNCLEDNGGAHNSNVSVQCVDEVEKLSLSHSGHEDNSEFSERYHNKQHDINLIDSEGYTLIVSQNDCNNRGLVDSLENLEQNKHQQRQEQQQLTHKHGYHLQPTCYQSMHSSNSADYQTLNDSIVIGVGESSANRQMSHLITGNEISVSLSDKSINLTNNINDGEVDDDDEEEGEEETSDEDNDEEDEVDDDDEDYVYEDVEDGDVEEEEDDDDDEDEEEGNNENEDDDYVIASRDNVGENCPDEDDEDVDDDDTDGIENSNDDDDDDSVDNSMNPLTHSDNTSLSLDGERMLEVTRKLVRSTERDPDRDLRKQVLLKTAIKKLPHFMEYNRYSESINHNLHLNGGSTPPINCMSPTQAAYYEHHHHHHHHHHHNHHHNLLLTQPHSHQDDHIQLDSQQKSFYYPVQPNAIQMSTTGLRMLDLNDDHDSETGTNESNMNCQKEDSNSQGYNNRTSLENTPSHDFESSLISQHPSESQTNLYTRYSQRSHAPKPTHPSDFIMDHMQQHKDPCPRNYDMGSHETTTDQLVGDNQSDNLYTSNENSDIGASIKTDERIPIAFQVACDVCDFNCVPGNCGKKLHVQETTSMDSITSLSTPISMHNNVLDDHHSEFGTQLEDDSESKDTLLSSQANNNDSGISNYCEDPMDEVDGVNLNESNTSSSSQDSSNDSNDSINLNHSIPQSFLETVDTDNPLIDDRLNTSPGNHSSPHDSGVSLFSPRSNKRSSSSIGLDDEMEIDNLTELSSAQNSSIGSNISQFKKLRKRETMD